MNHSVTGSILLGFGTVSRVLIEWLTTVEAADFTIVTTTVAWAMIVLGLALVGMDLWEDYKGQ